MLPFFIGRPDAAMQQTLLNSNLKLMNFAQADPLVQKFPSLSKIIFRVPDQHVKDIRTPVTLLAATALLVSKDSLHPALAYLLLEAAKAVHGGKVTSRLLANIRSWTPKNFPSPTTARATSNPAVPFCSATFRSGWPALSKGAC